MSESYTDAMQQKFDEDGQKKYCERLTWLTDYVSKIIIGHGKKFVCGDKMSIADFTIASYLYAVVYNSAFAGGDAMTSKGKAILEGNETMKNYINAL